MGRYFDRLCRIAEKENDPVLIQYLKEAKLFVFDGDPADFIPKAVDFDKAEELINGFFLPFQTVAIEDDKGVVLLRVDPTSTNHSSDIAVFDLIDNQNGDAQVTVSTIYDIKYTGDPESPLALYLYEDASAVLFGKDDKILRVIPASESDYADTEKFKNIAAALYEVMILNSPSRFVFEIAPARSRQHSKKILRSHDRPVYTLLTPGEIKKRYGMDGTQSPGGAGGGKVPHPRRRHLRTLHSEKFRHKQGQTISIPACWVGPEERRIGNKIYRVRLDV
ncbi:MAG: hypothetical protein HQL80_07020 [Magnetococcales bacterium]|nr:hypothetical protein [Magnetococcales bacterium]MBF0583971.1 hypothetical protein [Magnetococcales bacterium]